MEVKGAVSHELCVQPKYPLRMTGKIKEDKEDLSLVDPPYRKIKGSSLYKYGDRTPEWVKFRVEFLLVGFKQIHLKIKAKHDISTDDIYKEIYKLVV